MSLVLVFLSVWLFYLTVGIFLRQFSLFNVLVPVRPLAYLDGSKNKDKASELRGGYLYVFWKGKLWREMAITDKGYYQDIDVEYYRALYKQEQAKKQPKAIHREAEGFPLPQFWVPYKLLGEVQQGENGVKVLFSPKQKRFNQIEALESDPALLDKSSTPLMSSRVTVQSRRFRCRRTPPTLITPKSMPLAKTICHG
ncbi:hypothetical protein KW548_23620 [Vibrio neptunius]|nr:hypothetical protein KW548_23620 [Vibrio neptunius]